MTCYLLDDKDCGSKFKELAGKLNDTNMIHENKRSSWEDPKSSCHSIF
jgi:hypothetical protein